MTSSELVMEGLTKPWKKTSGGKYKSINRKKIRTAILDEVSTLGSTLKLTGFFGLQSCELKLDTLDTSDVELGKTFAEELPTDGLVVKTYKELTAELSEWRQARGVELDTIDKIQRQTLSNNWQEQLLNAAVVRHEDEPWDSIKGKVTEERHKKAIAAMKEDRARSYIFANKVLNAGDMRKTYEIVKVCELIEIAVRLCEEELESSIMNFVNNLENPAKRRPINSCTLVMSIKGDVKGECGSGYRVTSLLTLNQKTSFSRTWLTLECNNMRGKKTGVTVTMEMEVMMQQDKIVKTISSMVGHAGKISCSDSDIQELTDDMWNKIIESGMIEMMEETESFSPANYTDILPLMALAGAVPHEGDLNQVNSMWNDIINLIARKVGAKVDFIGIPELDDHIAKVMAVTISMSSYLKTIGDKMDFFIGALLWLKTCSSDIKQRDVVSPAYSRKMIKDSVKTWSNKLGLAGQAVLSSLAFKGEGEADSVGYRYIPIYILINALTSSVYGVKRLRLGALVSSMLTYSVNRSVEDDRMKTTLKDLGAEFGKEWSLRLSLNPDIAWKIDCVSITMYDKVGPVVMSKTMKVLSFKDAVCVVSAVLTDDESLENMEATAKENAAHLDEMRTRLASRLAMGGADDEASASKLVSSMMSIVESAERTTRWLREEEECSDAAINIAEALVSRRKVIKEKDLKYREEITSAVVSESATSAARGNKFLDITTRSAIMARGICRITDDVNLLEAMDKLYGPSSSCFIPIASYSKIDTGKHGNVDTSMSTFAVTDPRRSIAGGVLSIGDEDLVSVVMAARDDSTAIGEINESRAMTFKIADGAELTTAVRLSFDINKFMSSLRRMSASTNAVSSKVVITEIEESEEEQKEERGKTAEKSGEMGESSQSEVVSLISRALPSSLRGQAEIIVGSASGDTIAAIAGNFVNRAEYLGALDDFVEIKLVVAAPVFLLDAVTMSLIVALKLADYVWSATSRVVNFLIGPEEDKEAERMEKNVLIDTVKIITKFGAVSLSSSIVIGMLGFKSSAAYAIRMMLKLSHRLSSAAAGRTREAIQHIDDMLSREIIDYCMRKKVGLMRRALVATHQKEANTIVTTLEDAGGIGKEPISEISVIGDESFEDIKKKMRKARDCAILLSQVSMRAAILTLSKARVLMMKIKEAGKKTAFGLVKCARRLRCALKGVAIKCKKIMRKCKFAMFGLLKKNDNKNKDREAEVADEPVEKKKKKTQRRKSKKTSGNRRQGGWKNKIRSMTSEWILSKIASEMTSKKGNDTRKVLSVRAEDKSLVEMLKMWSFKERGDIEALVIATILKEDTSEDAYAIYGREREVRREHKMARLSTDDKIELHYSSENEEKIKTKANLAVSVVECNSCEVLSFDDNKVVMPFPTGAIGTGMRLSSMEDACGRWSVLEVQSLDDNGRRVFGWVTKIETPSEAGLVRIISAEHLLCYGSKSWCHVDCDDVVTLATYVCNADLDVRSEVRIDASGEGIAEFKNWIDPKTAEFDVLKEAILLEGSGEKFAMYQVACGDMRGLSGGPITIEPLGDVAIILSQIEGDEFERINMSKRKVVVGARIAEQNRQLIVLRRARVSVCGVCQMNTAAKDNKEMSPETETDNREGDSTKEIEDVTIVSRSPLVEIEEVINTESDNDDSVSKNIQEIEEPRTYRVGKGAIGNALSVLGGAMKAAKYVFLESDGEKVKKCASERPRNEFMMRSRVEAEQIAVVADMAQASSEFGLGRMTRAIINSIIESIYEDKVLIFICVDAATRTIVSSMLSVMEVEFKIATSLVSLIDMAKWAGRSGRRWVINTDIKIVISQEMSFGRPVVTEMSRIAKVVGVGVKQLQSESAVSVLTASCALISNKFELHLYESEEDRTSLVNKEQSDWDSTEREVTELMFISCVNGRLKMDEDDDSEIIIPQQQVKKMVILTDNYDSRDQVNLSLSVTRIAKCTRDGVTVLGVSSLSGDVMSKWIRATDMVAVITGEERVEDEFRRTTVMPICETSTDARQCLRDVVNIYKAKMNIRSGDWSLNRRMDIMLTNVCSAEAKDKRTQYCYQIFFREQMCEQVTLELAAKRLMSCQIQGVRIVEKTTFKEAVNEIMKRQGSNILEMDRLENGLMSEESEKFAMSIEDKRWRIRQCISRVKKVTMMTAAMLISKLKSKVRKVKKWAEKKIVKWASDITSFVPRYLKNAISWCIRKSRDRNDKMTKTSSSAPISMNAEGDLQTKDKSDIGEEGEVDSDSSDEGASTSDMEEENERMRFQVENYKLLIDRWWEESGSTISSSSDDLSSERNVDVERNRIKRIIKKTRNMVNKTCEFVGDGIRKVVNKMSRIKNNVKAKIDDVANYTKQKSEAAFKKTANVLKSLLNKLKSRVTNRRKENRCYNFRDREDKESAVIWKSVKEMLKVVVISVAANLKASGMKEEKNKLASKLMIGATFCISESIIESSIGCIYEPAGKFVKKIVETIIACTVVTDLAARLLGNEIIIDLGVLEVCLGKGGTEIAERYLNKLLAFLDNTYNNTIKPSIKVRTMPEVKIKNVTTNRRSWTATKTASLIRRSSINDIKWDAFEVVQIGQILAKIYTWVKRRILNWSSRSMLKKIWNMISNRAEYKGPTGVLKLSKCHSKPQKTLMAMSAGAMILGVGMLAREVAATDTAVIGALAERKNTADNINSFMKEAKVYARVTRLMSLTMSVIGATLGGETNKLVSLTIAGAIALEWATSSADEVGLTYGALDVLAKAAACGISPKLLYSVISTWWCDSSDGSLAVSTIILTSGKDRRRNTSRMLVERSMVVEKTKCPSTVETPSKRELDMFALAKRINEKERRGLAQLFDKQKQNDECVKNCMREMKGRKGDLEIVELEELDRQGKIDMKAGQEMVNLMEVANKTAMEVEADCGELEKEVNTVEDRNKIMIEEVFRNQCKYIGKMNFRREAEDAFSRPEIKQDSVEAVFWSEGLWRNVIDVAERREWKPAGDKRLDVILALAERNDKPAVFPERDEVMLRYCVGLSRWIESNMMERVNEIDMRIGSPDWKVTINSVNRKATSGILTRARTGLTIAASYLPYYVNNIAGARLAIIADRLSLTAKMVNVFAKRRVEKVKMGTVVKRKYVITRTIQAHETDLKLAVADIFATMDKTIKLTRNRTGVMVGMGMFKEFVQDDWATKMRSRSISEEEGREVLRVAIDHSSYDANQRLWAIETVKEIRKRLIDVSMADKSKAKEAKKIIDNIYEDLKLKWFVTAAGDVLLVSGQQMSGHATTSSDNSLRAMGYALECAEIIEREEGITIIKESIRVQGDDTKFDLMMSSRNKRIGKQEIEKAIETAMKMMGQDVKQDKMEIKKNNESCKFLSHYSERTFMVLAKVKEEVAVNYMASFEIPMRTREEIITMLATSLRSGTKRKTRREAQLIAAKAASFMIMYCGDAAIANISAIVLRIANALLSTFGQSKIRKLSVTLDKLPWLVRQGPILGEFSISMNEMLEIHGIGDESRGYYPRSWLVEQSYDNYKALEASLALIENATREMKNIRLKDDVTLMEHRKVIKEAIEGKRLTIEVSRVQELIISKNKLATMIITEGDVSYVPMNRLANRIKQSVVSKERGEKPIGRMVKITNEQGNKWNETNEERIKAERRLTRSNMANTRMIKYVESKEGIKMGLQSVKEIDSERGKIITMTEHEDMMIMTDFSRDIENVIIVGDEMERLVQRMYRNDGSILREIDVANEQIPIEMISALEIDDETLINKEEIEQLEDMVEERDEIMKRYVYDLIEIQVRNYIAF